MRKIQFQSMASKHIYKFPKMHTTVGDQPRQKLLMSVGLWGFKNISKEYKSMCENNKTGG